MVSRHRYSRIFPFIFVVIDTILLNLTFTFAFFFKFGLESSLRERGIYLELLIVINALYWALSITRYTGEKFRLNYNIVTEIINFIKLMALHIAVISGVWVLTKGYYLSREQLVITYALFGVVGSLWRFMMLFLLKWYRAKGYNLRNFAIVGYSQSEPLIRKYFDTYPEIGYRFAGYFDDNEEKLNINSLDELKIKIASYKIEVLYCCFPYLHSTKLKEIIDYAQHYSCEVKLIFDYSGFIDKRVNIEYHDIMPVINLSPKPFRDIQAQIFKRLFDISFSLICLLFLFPILIIIALITRCTSKGPVLFSQERMGQYGRPFRIYKFRSMYIDAEMRTGPALSQGDKDPRITGWGRMMRKTRMDELPQFFNVLKGDMSIVGPRPERQFFIDQIVEKNPDYQKLLSIKPGITSVGQVMFGYASDVNEMVDRSHHDMTYLTNVSLAQDVKIILQTMRVIVEGKGK